MNEYVYDFGVALGEWAHIPVDDFEYVTADELLALHPQQLSLVIDRAFHIRWDPSQWRNRDNTLLHFMEAGMDVAGKTVMDFGSGIGHDTLRFALRGAQVCPADIHMNSLLVAQRVVNYYARVLTRKLCLVGPNPPYFVSPKLDLFWSFGVLHHFPYAREIIRRACSLLNPGGECRICLYSDVRWREMTDSEPPAIPVHEHPQFAEFVRKNDPVGQYADWYDENKIKQTVDGFAEVTESRYLCDRQFIGAVIKSKGA